MGLKLAIRQSIGELAYRLGGDRFLPGSLSLLMYHAVTQEKLRDPQQQTVSVRQFSKQMETLRSLPVDLVPLEQGIASLRNGAGQKPMVSVVFDDGYVGIHDLAAPVLAQHRIPATLFLATGCVGTNAFPGASPTWGRPLTWPEVQALSRQGDWVVGSHGHSHRRLTSLSSEEIRRELGTSRDLIEKHLNQSCRLFAYPYGARGTFDARTENLLKEERFTVGCTALWGRCKAVMPLLHLPRMRISWADNPRELKKTLSGCYDWYRLFQV